MSKLEKLKENLQLEGKQLQNMQKEVSKNKKII
jgi:hypothetical protein